MFDPQMELLFTVLGAVVATPPGADWSDAQAALATCGKVEDDVVSAIGESNADAVRAILGSWLSGKRHLLEHDRDVLKRALKAYRKRLKVTLLDAESSLGGGPFSGGRKSSIVAITPPERYPRAVWHELVRQGRLLDAKQGMYELPPE